MEAGTFIRILLLREAWYLGQSYYNHEIDRRIVLVFCREKTRIPEYGQVEERQSGLFWCGLHIPCSTCHLGLPRGLKIDFTCEASRWCTPPVLSAGRPVFGWALSHLDTLAEIEGRYITTSV